MPKEKKPKEKENKPMKKRIKDKVLGNLARKGLKGATACLLGVLMFLAGCQTADPSSRSTSAEYEFPVNVTVNGTSNTVSVSVDIGDGATADASGGGDKNDNTATQTTDTKPEVAVALPGGTAGTGGSTPQSGIVSEALNKLLGTTSGGGATLTPQEVEAVKELLESNTQIQ